MQEKLQPKGFVYINPLFRKKAWHKNFNAHARLVCFDYKLEGRFLIGFETLEPLTIVFEGYN